MALKAPLPGTYAHFAHLLMSYRRRLGLSQQEVAAMGGIHPSDLSKIERNVKKPPHVNVLLQLVDELKLSGTEAHELIEAAGYSTSVLKQVKFDLSKYPVAVGSTEERLKGSHGFWPVWELDTEGKFIAANLLAFRLWRALDEADETITPNRLLGTNIFEVIVRPENFCRISMPTQQSDFWYTTIAVWKKLKDQVPIDISTTFEEVIKANPVLSLLLRYGTVDIAREWDYDLYIAPSIASPTFDEPKVYLEFQIHFERVITDGLHTGYIVTCQPIRPFTNRRTEREYSRLIATYGKEAFVQRESDTHLLEEAEKYPSFFPAVHHDPVWAINFENTEFKTLIDDEDEKFTGQHYFVMLLNPNIITLLGLDKQKLLIPMRQFIQSTKAYEDEQSPYYEQFTQIKADLLRQASFQSLLTELWQPLLVPEVPLRPEEGIPCFSVEIPCPFTNTFKLSCDIVARQPTAYETDYRVTFVPTTVTTKATLILLRLQANEAVLESIGTTEYEQLTWLVAVLKTLREGFTKKKGDAWWHPESGFKQIHSDLVGTAKVDNPTEAIKLQAAWTLTQLLFDDKSRQEEMLALLKAFVKPASYAYDFLMKGPQHS